MTDTFECPVLADTEHEMPRGVAWKDAPMAVRYPDEFRQRPISWPGPATCPAPSTFVATFVDLHATKMHIRHKLGPES